MIEPNTTMTYEGQPLEVLESLIEKRKELLGETVKDAVTATAITVLKSLRADTKIAPKKAKPESFKITDTGYVGGWERVGGKFHRVVRATNARHAPKIQGIFPVNNAGQHCEKGEVVKVYKIEPVNDPAMSWDRTKHKGCWYIFAKSEGVAKQFAIRHMTNRINSYRGLAKTTLGFAMAAVSTRGTFAADVKSAKAKIAAYNAAQVFHSDGFSGNYSLNVTDLLRYSANALKSGKDALVRAMMKASNSIAGRLSKIACAKLKYDIPTPFPEVKG